MKEDDPGYGDLFDAYFQTGMYPVGHIEAILSLLTGEEAQAHLASVSYRGPTDPEERISLARRAANYDRAMGMLDWRHRNEPGFSDEDYSQLAGEIYQSFFGPPEEI